jgi:hypothetical protein
MEDKKLGKISHVSFGHGGYQDAQIGLSVTLSGEGWGVQDFKGYWDAEIIECSKNCKWTEKDRDELYSGTMRALSKILKDAKVHSVAMLKDIPVEATFEGNTLKSWRILTEVL